ncbi:hypothetical protein D0866_02003 [Hortaea werneckii]|nr:hypothetical protein D0866_02003 [Hortaea werneckii]
MPSSLSILSLATLVFLPVATSSPVSLVDNGTVVTLGGVPYYSGGTPVAMLSVAADHELQTLAPLDSDVIPMTVIRTNHSTFGIAEFNETISSFDDMDDVFTRDFLASVFLDYLGASSFRPSIAKDMTAHPHNTSGPWTTLMTAEKGVGLVSASLSCSLPNGPYFVSARTGAVFKAHRLYPDDYLTFIQGIISDEAGGYLSLPAVTENVMAKSVAVPSRLYATISPEKPLAGLRLGVKDIYHVKGVKTSGGNRAYFYLYEAQNVTAPAVQRLIDQGAILVGKMGTVQFANGDSPIADWVDLHCPFNPRADGYQDPSGSSTGPGAGIGAYDWLDIAVGSDTGGSMRGPAGGQGIYGNRPSTGAISMDHVIPLTPTLDTAGVFARSASRHLRPLFADYEAAHHGRSPYINPGPLVRWQWGISRNESYDSAVHNMTVFRGWWETQGYGRNDTETCSKGIFVYPWSLGTPNYRDTYLDPPTQPPLGFANWAIAGYAAGGELVVPVGEVPYQSRITHQTEYLPVSVSLLVAHGCDLVLANLVRDLEMNGILKPSATGRRI